MFYKILGGVIIVTVTVVMVLAVANKSDAPAQSAPVVERGAKFNF